MAPQSVLDTLIANGQIATQYVDQDGSPSMDMKYNPNGSVLAIEGITSPDGRVFGKMGHSERSGEYLYKNVTGDKYQPCLLYTSRRRVFRRGVSARPVPPLRWGRDTSFSG